MLKEHQQIHFTQLWTDAQPIVTQYVASLVRDQWAVHDIVQNTSLALLRKFSQYDDSRPFIPWALGIAKFEILGSRRDAARNRMVSDPEFLERYTRTWAEVAPHVSEDAAALRHCIGELKGKSRTIIRMRYAEERTSETIARELEITAANVRTILKRTRDVLRRCVQKQITLWGGEA